MQPHTHGARLCAAALAAWLATTPGAHAGDVTPGQAATLEAQLRNWAGGLLGPAVKLPERPVQLAPAGDHFDVTVPIRAPSSAASSGLRLTATARPAENGTWAIDGIRWTTPARFTMQMPVPPQPGAQPGAKPGARPGSKPNPAADATQSVPVDVTVDMRGQDGRILWDPSGATPSVWTTSVQGTTVHTEGGPILQDSQLGPSSTVTTFRPAGPGRVDVLSEGTLQDYRISSTSMGNAMDLAFQRIRVTSALNGVSRSGGTAIVQAIVALVASASGAPAPAAADPARALAPPGVIRALLAALQDLATDLQVDETIDGVAVKAQGQAVGIEHVKLGLSARSEAGLLHAGMEMGMEGLALPDLQLGDMAVLLPRRVMLRPVVAGLGIAELLRIANARNDGLDPAPQDVAALFTHGGITAGLDSMAVEVGGAVFGGQGRFLATGPSPDQVSGTAQITADHFDGLMQTVQGIPGLARAVPVLLFVKGVGRAAGDQIVWDISWKDGALLVNNVDLSAMAGGGAPRPPPPQVAPESPGGPVKRPQQQPRRPSPG